MPDRDLFVTIHWRARVDRKTSRLTLTGRDDMTQRDYTLEVPLHAIPGLIDALSILRELHAESILGVSSTRLV